MLATSARALGALVLVASFASAQEGPANLRPGNPVVDYPGNGDNVGAEKPVVFKFHMPPSYADPCYYEVALDRRSGKEWSRVAESRASGSARESEEGFQLDPGTYVVYLKAFNGAGNASASPHIFTVVAPKDAKQPNANFTGAQAGTLDSSQ